MWTWRRQDGLDGQAQPQPGLQHSRRLAELASGVGQGRRALGFSPSEMAFWISAFLTFGDGVLDLLQSPRPAAAGEPGRATASLVAGEQGRSARRLAVVRPCGRSDAGGPRREWGKPAGAAGGQQVAGVRRAAGCQRRRRPRALEEAGVCGACVWMCVCGARVWLCARA